MIARRNPRRFRQFERSPEGGFGPPPREGFAGFVARVTPRYVAAMHAVAERALVRWRVGMRDGLASLPTTPAREVALARLVAATARDLFALWLLKLVASHQLFVRGTRAKMGGQRGRRYDLDKLQAELEAYASAYGAWVVATAEFYARPEVAARRAIEGLGAAFDARPAATADRHASEATRALESTIAVIEAAYETGHGFSAAGYYVLDAFRAIGAVLAIHRFGGAAQLAHPFDITARQATAYARAAARLAARGESESRPDLATLDEAERAGDLSPAGMRRLRELRRRDARGRASPHANPARTTLTRADFAAGIARSRARFAAAVAQLRARGLRLPMRQAVAIAAAIEDGGFVVLGSGAALLEVRPRKGVEFLPEIAAALDAAGPEREARHGWQAPRWLFRPEARENPARRARRGHWR